MHTRTGEGTGTYSTSEVARLLALSPQQIRSFVRTGLLDPRRDLRGNCFLSFSDLVLLRTAKELAQHVPARRVRKALRQLKEKLPHGRGLVQMRIRADGHRITVQDDGSAWEAESGQSLLNFSVAELAADVAPLVERAVAQARADEDNFTAEEWYAIGCDLETVDLEQARDAYRRALERDPSHCDARLNLGCLLHELGAAEAAEKHYRLVLMLHPNNPTAAFNLGVVYEDLERLDDAVTAYTQALELDPQLADAHFNLGHLYEKQGKPRLALRHLQAYRRLTRT